MSEPRMAFKYDARDYLLSCNTSNTEPSSLPLEGIFINILLDSRAFLI